jgi:hypothetical protein
MTTVAAVLWREQRDPQKFQHMLWFADALPALRAATPVIAAPPRRPSRRGQAAVRERLHR